MGSRVALARGLGTSSHQTLFKAAKMRGVSFDLFHNVGCVFSFLDVFHSLFSILAVERTAENCAKKMVTAIAAVADGPGPRGAPGASTKVAAPRDAAVPIGRESEAHDGLTINDVQMALRSALKRWTANKPRH